MMKHTREKSRFKKLVSSGISTLAIASLSASALAATVLDNAVPVTGLSGASGSQVFYEMTVPAGSTDLSFNMSGGSGDADLFVKFGSQASSSNWDCRPYRYGNDEVCSFDPAQTGTYSVMLDAWSAYSGVTLVASYTEAGEPPPPPPPSSGVTNAAAAGDSMTRAFGADCSGNVWFWDLWCLLGGDQPEHSWFDGWSSNVNSVADRYRALDSSINANKHASQSGAEMSGEGDQGSERNFAEQAAVIVGQSPVPDHVEVLLGGNDLCNRDCVDPANCSDPLYSDSDWRQSVRDGLNILMTGLPAGSSVVMGSVPGMHHLLQAGLDLQSTSSSINCQSLWSTYGVCRIVTNTGTMNGESSAVRLAGVAAAQQSYNAILREEVDAYNSNSNGLNPNGIELVSEYVDENTPSGGTFEFQAQHINGGDCFHPNVATQGGVVAEFLWNANPFMP